MLKYGLIKVNKKHLFCMSWQQLGVYFLFVFVSSTHDCLYFFMNDTSGSSFYPEYFSCEIMMCIYVFNMT